MREGATSKANREGGVRNVALPNSGMKNCTGGSIVAQAEAEYVAVLQMD